MERNIEDEVRLIEAYIHEEGKQGEEPQEEIYHVYDVPGGIVILREGEIPGAGDATVIDSIPAEVEPQTNVPTTALPEQTPVLAQVIISMYLLLIFSCLMFQIYLLINPFTVTVTLAARTQQVSLTGTLQLGRVLNPITASQSGTAQATGRGHQDARAAGGTVTFYNGLFTVQTVPAGTLLTGNDGEQIITDQDANIPAGNPPTYGQVTVSAHAINKGARGNIQPYDINQKCCSSGILAKNTAPFQGGADERNYQFVTKTDINNAATPLKATLNQSVQGALQGQLKTNEDLAMPSCKTTTTADHQIGQEATIVNVSASETCSGIAYNPQELTDKVTRLLTSQVTKKLQVGYSILGNPEVSITQASSQENKVVLSFKAQSTWIYALSSAEQKHIKKIIAGKNKQQALQLLNSLPGIESVSMQSSGFGDDTKLPKDISHIHMLVIYAAGVA